MCFILGVPTVPLLPQVNQSLASVPPVNPATTLPSKQQSRDMLSDGICVCCSPQQTRRQVPVCLVFSAISPPACTQSFLMAVVAVALAEKAPYLGLEWLKC